MIIPQKLKSGDSIGILATARKVSKDEIKPCVELLQSWGLKVVFSPNLFEVEHQFAGSDSQRTSDLQWAINHKELKAVIVARGGYGTSRMIDGVDFTNLHKYPKWFIGFSDVTVLLGQLYNNACQSLHAPVALLLAKEGHEESREKLKDFLFSGDTDKISSDKNEFNIEGEVTAPLVGGNLSIIHTILATESDFDTKGKILFIEDLDEYLYHIDRMLVHLDRAGKLKNLAGLVVGHMSDMNDNAIPFGKNCIEIIDAVVAKYDFPVAYNFPIGHEATNHPVVIGAQYCFKVKNKGASLELA